MSTNRQTSEKAEALAVATRIVRTFKVQRRLEDEPAHHAKALERLAEPEPER